MVDFVKKNWQFRDIISENELNRIEDGIEEGITKAEQADQKAQQAQQTANQAASDLAAHLNDDVSHITSAERTYWNSKQDALPVENRRKITFGTADPVGGEDGDIYFQYE